MAITHVQKEKENPTHPPTPNTPLQPARQRGQGPQFIRRRRIELPPPQPPPPVALGRARHVHRAARPNPNTSCAGNTARFAGDADTTRIRSAAIVLPVPPVYASARRRTFPGFRGSAPPTRHRVVVVRPRVRHAPPGTVVRHVIAIIPAKRELHHTHPRQRKPVTQTLRRRHQQPQILRNNLPTHPRNFRFELGQHRLKKVSTRPAPPPPRRRCRRAPGTSQ